jgi:hypothetical protein
MLAILSIVIGILFSLLLMSILASTIHDIWAMLSSLHSKQLHRTLGKMLGEKFNDFSNHPFFRQLADAEDGGQMKPASFPDWIDKKTFSSVLVDILQHGVDSQAGKTLEYHIARITDPRIKAMLEYLLRESDGTIEGFKHRAEHWFSEVMQRTTSWFGRSTKMRLFFIGLVTATLLNVDTIQIYRRLSANADLREAIERDAERFVNNNPQFNQVVNPVVTPVVTEGVQVVTVTDTAQLIAAKKAIIDTLRTQYYDKYSTGLGFGWEGQTTKDIPDFLVKILGLLLTAISVTFGAPFWFELLRKLLPYKGASTTAPAPQVPSTPVPSGKTTEAVGITSPKPEPLLPDLLSTRGAQKPPAASGTKGSMEQTADQPVKPPPSPDGPR